MAQAPNPQCSEPSAGRIGSAITASFMDSSRSSTSSAGMPGSATGSKYLLVSRRRSYIAATLQRTTALWDASHRCLGRPEAPSILIGCAFGLQARLSLLVCVCAATGLTSPTQHGCCQAVIRYGVLLHDVDM